MNEDILNTPIPLDVIAGGREIGDVLAEFETTCVAVHQDAALDDGADDWAGSFAFAVYRIYLLGVEDGMKIERGEGK